MRIDILTIFPSFFDSFLGESLLKKAIDKGILDIRVHDLREYTNDKHRKVDDILYGGGAGMVMSPQPIVNAIESLKKESPARIILLTPRGEPFNQEAAERLSGEDRLILVCGRYEGVDERVSEGFIDEEISIGDFVLNGGEVAAMAVIETLFRLLPGTIGAPESLEIESFKNCLLEHPQYTRPENFRGMKVPEVLLSGHHENIKKWRYEKAVEKTRKVRPDLLVRAAQRLAPKINFSIALVHYPVLGKDGKTITGSITTIDVHDMARIGKTYGAKTVYMVTPVEDQKRLVERLKNYWIEGDFLKGHFERRVEALSILEVVSSMDEMLSVLKHRSKRVKILATSAVESSDTISPDEWILRHGEADEWIILFGTAYGLAPEILEKADCRLSPVRGRGEFYHLPVRGASAIILDRLFGNWRKF